MVTPSLHLQLQLFQPKPKPCFSKPCFSKPFHMELICTRCVNLYIRPFINLLQERGFELKCMNLENNSVQNNITYRSQTYHGETYRGETYKDIDPYKHFNRKDILSID